MEQFTNIVPEKSVFIIEFERRTLIHVFIGMIGYQLLLHSGKPSSESGNVCMIKIVPEKAYLKSNSKVEHVFIGMIGYRLLLYSGKPGND